MSAVEAEVFAAALQLSKDARVALREAIDESLAEEADVALEAELNRRWQEFQSGASPGIPADELDREVEARYGKKL